MCAKTSGMESMLSVLPWGGTLLQAALLLRLVTWRAWRDYPWFFSFMAILSVRLFLIHYQDWTKILSGPDYAYWYWTTSILAAAFWFPVSLEAFRDIFGRGTVLSQVAGIVLIGSMAALALWYLYGAGFPGLYRLPDVQQKAALTIAVWVVVLVFLAGYYRIPVKRNAWGIILGLGLFTSVSVINFAGRGLEQTFYPVFQFVQPASWVATLGIWTWALWSRSPASDRAETSSPAGAAPANLALPAKKTAEAIRKALGL